MASSSNERSCKHLADNDFGRPWARPEALSSAAIVRFGLAEQASIDEPSKPFGRSSINWARPSGALCQWLRRLVPLACAFFVDAHERRSQQRTDCASLRMSYRVGPARRVGRGPAKYIALENFPELPPDLADAAVTEFKDLVASGYSHTPSRSWSVRVGHPRHVCCVASRMCRTRARPPIGFCGERAGYDLAVPGFERPEPRRGDKYMRRP